MWNLNLILLLNSLFVLSLPLIIYANSVFGETVGDVLFFCWYGLLLLIRTLRGQGIFNNTFSMWILASAFFSLLLTLIMFGFNLEEITGLIRLREFFRWIPSVLVMIETFGGGGGNQGPPRRKEKRRNLKLRWTRS